MDDRVDDHGPEHSKFTHFGGNFAINARQNLMITTEWGPPKLVKLGFQLEDLDQEQAYGTAINIWDLSPRRLRQTIRLNKFDGSMTMCVRFYHNPELNHSFACSAVGGCIFHIHKDTRNDEYRADKVAQFPAARVDGWIRDEMPAMPVDM
ncbi:selenium-binding protein, partial [Aphelenchoides avenae]